MEKLHKLYFEQTGDPPLLLQILAGQGITFRLVGNELKIRTPKGLLTPELKQYASRHKERIIQEIQSSLSIQHWINQVQSATTLSELEQCLQEFSERPWTLLDKRDLSAAYTAHALKLIEIEEANKWQTLEHLAELCWSNRQVK